MVYERIETPKIKETKIIAPYYPESQDCVYCEGSYPVDPTRFDVHLENDIKIEKVCPVCLYEIFLEYPEYIVQIVTRRRMAYNFKIEEAFTNAHKKINRVILNYTGIQNYDLVDDIIDIIKKELKSKEIY